MTDGTEETAAAATAAAAEAVDELLGLDAVLLQAGTAGMMTLLLLDWRIFLA